MPAPRGMPKETGRPADIAGVVGDLAPAGHGSAEMLAAGAREWRISDGADRASDHDGNGPARRLRLELPFVARAS